MTTVAIHQPNYLPWIGYFHKIKTADTFVYLDNVEFNSDSVTHRNQIKTNDGKHWLTVPVASSSSTTIKNIEIDNTKKWQKNHKKTLSVHYANAPHFEDQKSLLTVYDQKWNSLANLNIRFIDKLLSVLDFETDFYRASSLPVTGSGTDLLVNICESVSGDSYFSGSGADDYLEEDQFDRAGIELVYQDIDHPRYEQRFGNFISHLSIIDAVFNVGGRKTAQIIENL